MIRSFRLGCSSNPASLLTVSLPIVSLPAVYAENFYLKANVTIFIYLRIALGERSIRIDRSYI